MNKRIISKWSNYLNIFWIITFSALLMVEIFTGYDGFKPELYGLFMILHTNSLIFWLWNIGIWYKYDKNFLQLLGLLCLMFFYSPFYYARIIRQGWLEQNDEKEGKVVRAADNQREPSELKKGISRILKLCFLGIRSVFGNIFVIFFLLVFLSMINYNYDQIVSYFIYLFSPVVLVAFVYSIVIWAQHGQKIGPLFLLVPFYNLLGIFYFIRILKKKWV